MAFANPVARGSNRRRRQSPKTDTKPTGCHRKTAGKNRENAYGETTSRIEHQRFRQETRPDRPLPIVYTKTENLALFSRICP